MNKSRRHCYDMKNFLTFILGILLASLNQSHGFSVPTRIVLTRPPSVLKASTMTTTTSTRFINEQPPSKKALRFRNRDDEAETCVELNTSTTENKSDRSIQVPVLGAVVLSQVLTLTVASVITAVILYLNGYPIDLNVVHWNGGDSYFGLLDFEMTPLVLLQSVLTALPMIYLGHQVEHSDGRDCSRVNFSTVNMVMTLFGRRKHEHARIEEEDDHDDLHETSMPQALMLVTAIATLTGLSEELVFRGLLPFWIALVTHNPLAAWLGQSLVFGILHTSPTATAGENRLVAGLQTMNGLWYGLVYLATGGNVLQCILAHILYDSHIFMETWMSTNNQMDYTQQAVSTTSEELEQELRQLQKESQGLMLDDSILEHMKRFFYAFDYNHVGTLSKSDLQKAVSYAFLQDKIQPSQARVDQMFDKVMSARTSTTTARRREEEGRLNLADFMRVLFALKANPKGNSIKA